MILPEGGGFYTALIHIGTSLVSYRLLLEEGVFTQPYSISYSISLWTQIYPATDGGNLGFCLERGFLYSPIPSLTVLHYENRVDFLSIRCFCLKEGFFTQPYFISAHLWYHTMLLLEEGVFTQPYSISYSITLWLKGTRKSYYSMLHTSGYFTLFLSSVHCCTGYLSVLAWQAAKEAARSPPQAS